MWDGHVGRKLQMLKRDVEQQTRQTTATHPFDVWKECVDGERLCINRQI